MDSREMETLVQRLVNNPHDQDAIRQAHAAGQRDPKSYAMLLEKVGTATADPAFACHWLTEAANVWSVTLNDAHRAARALMIAIDRDPTQPTPAERLADLYREKGDSKALVALLERRAKALGPLAQRDAGVAQQLAGIHEELGRLWAAEPLSQPKKAQENYRRAVELDPNNQFAIYTLRELLKAAGQWAEAIPYFEMELKLVDDRERRIALRQDEGEARRSARDFAGAAQALRDARAIEGGSDPSLRQLLATVFLEWEQSGARLGAPEASEGTQLFVSLAEEYPGEHGLSYSLCALELEPGNDRAVQLAMYYAGELGRLEEAAPRAAAYVGANPNGPLAEDARTLAQQFGQPIPAAPAARSARGSIPAGAGISAAPAAATTSVSQSSFPAVTAPAPAADTDQVAALIEQAQTLARKARKNDAAQKYREVLALEASNLDAISFLEPYLKQLRKFGELRDIMRRAAADEGIDMEQRVTWLREAAGLSESQLRDPNGAVAALEELLALDPESEDSRASLKRLLERAGRWDDLARVLEQEAEMISDVEARITAEKAIARLHEQKRKDPAGAGEAWTRIAALVPEDDSALETAIELFEKGGRPDRAAQAISDALPSIASDETRAALLDTLGGFRLAANEPAQAGEAYAESAALMKNAAVWHKAEKAFAQAEVWEQAASAADERAQLADRPSDKAKLYAVEASYLSRAGDEASAVERLEQATELDPIDDELAQELEQRYETAERLDDLVAFLLRRAGQLPAGSVRSGLRRRAADMQRDRLGDGDAARETLLALLEDGDDLDALGWLADDAEQRGDASAAAEFLGRLSKAATEPEQKIKVLLREAGLYSGALGDAEAAISRYERILDDLDPKHDEALAQVAELYQGTDNHGAAAAVLERRLKLTQDEAIKLEVANKLADLYEGPIDDPKAAIRVLDVVRGLDSEDFGAIQRLAELCERTEDWARVAEHLEQLMEVEGDEDEVSRMTRRRAEILHQKVGKGDEALAALLEMADRGDAACREEYVRLGDELGWKGVVAVKLVEWNLSAPSSPARTEALHGAFDRFLGVERKTDAAALGKEIARIKGTDAVFARRLEKLAGELTDLDVLAVSHDLLVQDLTGPARAEEFVRQAEVLVETGVDAEAAIQHGEQALTSVPPADVEPLLSRLAKLCADPARVIEIYERQVSRCKNPADRLSALAKAARVAAEHGDFERARGFFDLVLGAGVQEEAIESLEAAARTGDAEKGTDKLRRTLAESLAAGGQGARDGGRTRSAMLGRAARIAFEDLADREQAFTWIGDAIIAHVSEERLEQLESFAHEVGDPKRSESVLGRALEEVFDGPLVRLLLARRASIRRDQLSDPQGAAADLRRLHDLSPSDANVVERLLALYDELSDWRGTVQLYEDQILRGKDPAARAELARKVARLWEAKLDDPREAADAWRRVLRMKQGDPEAVEGLERAKSGMLKRPKDEPASSVDASPKPETDPAPAPEPLTDRDPPVREPEAVGEPEPPPTEAAPEPAQAEGQPEPAKPEVKENGGKKKKKRESKAAEANEKSDVDALLEGAAASAPKAPGSDDVTSNGHSEVDALLGDSAAPQPPLAELAGPDVAPQAAVAASEAAAPLPPVPEFPLIAPVGPGKAPQRVPPPPPSGTSRPAPPPPPSGSRMPPPLPPSSMRPLPPPAPGVRLAPPPPAGPTGSELAADDDGVDVDDAELFEDSKHE
jgi:cellulose synthase operon protein C